MGCAAYALPVERGAGGLGHPAGEVERLVRNPARSLVESAVILALREPLLVERADEPDDGVQLVDGPVCADARRVLGHAPASDEPRLAAVAGARVDASDADGHERLRGRYST